MNAILDPFPPQRPMTTTSRAPRRGIRRLIATVAVSTVVMASAIVGAAPTYASSPIGWAGASPGSVTTGVAYGYWSQYKIEAFGNDRVAQFRVPDLTFYRSPATSGAQTVTYVYQLNRWNGTQWQAYMTLPAYQATIPAGYSNISVAPGTFLQPPPGYYYYVDVSVVWSSGATGLGGVRIAFNEARDYGCSWFERGLHQKGQCIVYQAGYLYLS